MLLFHIIGESVGLIFNNAFNNIYVLFKHTNNWSLMLSTKQYNEIGCKKRRSSIENIRK